METAWMVALEASAIAMAYTITPTIVPDHTLPRSGLARLRGSKLPGLRYHRLSKMANSTRRETRDRPGQQ